MSHTTNAPRLLFLLTLFLTSKFSSSVLPDGLCDDYRMIAVSTVGYDEPCGVKVSLDSVQKQPIVKGSDALDNQTFTLMMVDPDARSRAKPDLRYWLHWLVFNITGKEMREGCCPNRAAAVAWYPPAPPPKTGYHRYQMLMYEQKTVSGYDPVVPSADLAKRGKFNPVSFSKTNKLKLLAAYQFETERPNEPLATTIATSTTTMAPNTTASSIRNCVTYLPVVFVLVNSAYLGL